MFTEPKGIIIKDLKKGMNDNVASNREYQQRHRNYIYFKKHTNGNPRVETTINK